MINQLNILWETKIPRDLYAKIYSPWRRINFEAELLQEIFSRHGAKKLVEFGCGLGRHGYSLWKRGFDVLLTDVRDWRYGVAKKLPFKIYDVLSGGFLGEFDGGYAINFMILLEPSDMLRALINIKKNLRRDGVFVFDYNFKAYEEPAELVISHRGERYRVLLRDNRYIDLGDHWVYRYRIEVLNGNKLIGFEEASYPIYPREVVEDVISRAGFEISERIYLEWDPVKYMYRYGSSKDLDSILYVLKSSRRD